ncbi:unnamed protein product [Heligmosomoides polygyrus]|uniref:Reverse transcriptase domain-containing protein n=1 Tax=Heligmosomoides polygyrus TaxID=6339 RepID=A0A183FX53_HELPZ|nr:unnamed protein product [Heligmosomoides polygyrus]
MKSGKATGPDDLPADLWKSKGWCPIDWLTEFSSQVVAEKKVPESWQQCTRSPRFGRRRAVLRTALPYNSPFFTHLKVFERIVNKRIRDVIELSTSQCGFVSGCGTVDAINAVRLLLEKHREK